MGVVSHAIGILNTVPKLARITAGFEASVPFPQIIMPPKPAASAVRKIAPRLPGFSMPSRIKSGASGRGLKSATESV